MCHLNKVSLKPAEAPIWDRTPKVFSRLVLISTQQ